MKSRSSAKLYRCRNCAAAAAAAGSERPVSAGRSRGGARAGWACRLSAAAASRGLGADCGQCRAKPASPGRRPSSRRPPKLPPAASLSSPDPNAAAQGGWPPAGSLPASRAAPAVAPRFEAPGPPRPPQPPAHRLGEPPPLSAHGCACRWLRGLRGAVVTGLLRAHGCRFCKQSAAWVGVWREGRAKCGAAVQASSKWTNRCRGKRPGWRAPLSF